MPEISRFYGLIVYMYYNELITIWETKQFHKVKPLS
jgi:hypothetical protein